MLKPDDKIMVAVSGGKDSVTLLYILNKIEKSFPKAKLYAVTVDEGIRGYRDEALKVAEETCRELDIGHIIVSFKEMYGYKLDEIVKITGKGLAPCSYCGVLRRRALNIAAREYNADKLSTAHNLDDETQTMLLNILHGDVPRISRVKPIQDVLHPKLIQRIKPLCEVPERDIALYAYISGIRFQNIPCPYVEYALRSDIRTILNRLEEKHPGIKFTIFRSMEKVRSAFSGISGNSKIQECKICGEPTVGKVCQSCQMLQKISNLR